MTKRDVAAFALWGIGLCLTAGTAQSRQPADSTTVWQVPRSVWFWGQVSSDGRLLPYFSTDTREIYLRDLTTGTDRRLTHTARAFESSGDPGERHGDTTYTVSRNSRRVAFSWEVDGEAQLRVVHLDEPDPLTPVVLVRGTEWISAWDWLPNGSHVIVTIQPKGGAGQQLALVSAEGGAVQVLRTASPMSGNAFTGVAASPDGAWIAFNAVRDGGGPRDIFVVDARTGQQAASVADDSDDQVLGWSLAGDALAVLRSREGAIGIWEAKFSSAGLGPLRLLRDDVGDIEPLGMSTSGALYFRPAGQEQWRSAVAQLDFSTGDVLSDPADVAPPSPGAWLYPASWSPDGTSLFYEAYTPDGPRRAMLRDTATGVLRDIGPTWATMRPKWSPDGSAIAIPSRTSECCGVDILDLQTGATRSLIDGVNSVLAWSADGRRLYVTRVVDDGTFDTAILEVDLTAAPAREILRWSGGEAVRIGIAMSPDGKTIYRRVPGRASAATHQLVARDVQTGEERTLRTGGSLGSIALSSAGRFIVTTIDGRPALVSTDSGAERPLPLIEDRVPQILVWAPDDSSFLARVRHRGLSGGPSDTSYWWVPVEPGRRARRLDWDVGPFAHGFVAGPAGLAFAERLNDRSPSDEVRVLRGLLSGSGR